jgi:hypothetical protein
VKKKFLDTDHPWFRPLWVRILVVAACLLWAALEFGLYRRLGLPGGSPFWGVLFLALGVYAGYRFFIDFNPPPPGGDTKPPEPE